MPYIERPRERLLYFGADELSNAELIAILLGSGSKKFPVMEIADQLARYIDNQPENISVHGIDRLCEIKGIGQTRAILLMAAIELGKRAYTGTGGPQRLRSSRQITDYLKPCFAHLEKSAYFLVLFNSQRELLATQEIAFIAVDEPVKVDGVISAAHDAKAFEIILCRLASGFPKDLLAKEKAFFIQLDEAANMLRMPFSTLFVRY